MGKAYVATTKFLLYSVKIMSYFELMLSHM